MVASMRYKEKVIANLREQIEPSWQENQLRRQTMGWNEITLEEQLEILFNQRVNCGGYALELDGCVFPAYNGNFDEVISGVLEHMPFVRLLGDSTLLDDEYLVVYRANQNGAHHFIKIQDGLVTEKNECNKIQQFSGWPKALQHSPQAVFAVKKEHDIEIKNQEGESKLSLMLDDILGKDFHTTVEDAVLNGQREFYYHQHRYKLEINRNESGRAFICSNGRIVGEIMIDGGECIVDVKAEDENYVSNTSPTNKKYLEILKEDIQI